MRFLFVTGLLLLMFRPSQAQEMLGAAFSNYAGQMGIAWNPATIVGMPHRWELNLLSGDFAAQNNYMRLRKDSRWIRRGIQGEAVDENRFTDLYTTSDKWMYGSAFLKYPSFVWSGKKFALAANISTRFEASGQQVPHHLAKFMKEGFDYNPLQRRDWAANRGEGAVLNWHELSLTGGMNIHDDGVNYWSGALTLNYNIGLNGIYASIDDMKYNSIADILLLVYNLNGEYGHALPDNGEDGIRKSLEKKGSGFSGSIGFRYFLNRNDAWFNPCKKKDGAKPYDLRIGFAVTDIGYVDFDTRAYTYKVNNLNTDWFGIDTVNFDGIGHTDSVLGIQFVNNPTGLQTGRQFRIYTPAAANIDVDVPLNSWFFLNLAAIQRLPLGEFRVRRMNEVSLTPRVEFRRFEFAMPLSLYEYSALRLGAALRIGAFTFGTDVLSPFLNVTDSYGADFYFGITLRNFGSCGNSNGGKGKRPKMEKCNTPAEN
jgi:hypothetical protein